MSQVESKKPSFVSSFQKSAENSMAQIEEAHQEIEELSIKKASLWDALREYLTQMNNYRREWGINMTSEQKILYNNVSENYWKTLFAHTSTGNSIFSKFSSIRMYTEDLNFSNHMINLEQYAQNINKNIFNQTG